MNDLKTLVSAVLLVTGCAEDASVSAADRQQISAAVERRLREAYDLSAQNVPERMLDLYASSGRVVSASGGSVILARDTLEAGIRYFWNNVGANMRDPRWTWERFYVDVLSPTSAVVTATYKIPHRNPSNQPHVLGGALTAVFQLREGRWVIIQEHLSDLPQAPDSSASIDAHIHQ